ncbi:plant virulence effector HPE1-like domain-containing protein [Rhizobium sp. LjRoot30]|uniref:plant virulence effector HPE1-like domain-containing protein n=1 Tax=Rhizobium sp. LjRoot30 TaxID=3342320 RepID=UPI003ECEA9A5
MRFFLLASAFSVIACSALASSVEPVTTKVSAGSIVTKSCDACPELKITKSKRAYIVPTLKEGTQVTEIRDINGEKKMVRTEAWLGGSPVVFVSKAPEGAVTASATAGQPAQAADIELPATGVDATATTAAVGVAGAEEPAIATSTPTLDATNFNLRVE